MSIRKFCLVPVMLGFLAESPATAEVLPEFLLDDLAPFLDTSTREAIDPGVYELSRANQAYADEIACILVKFFGQAEQVEQDMIAVVDDSDQKVAISRSIENCEKAGEEFRVSGQGSVKKTFNRGLTRGR